MNHMNTLSNDIKRLVLEFWNWSPGKAWFCHTFHYPCGVLRTDWLTERLFHELEQAPAPDQIPVYGYHRFPSSQCCSLPAYDISGSLARLNTLCPNSEIVVHNEFLFLSDQSTPHRARYEHCIIIGSSLTPTPPSNPMTNCYLKFAAPWYHYACSCSPCLQMLTFVE